jgi:cyclomaltodextrinase / maltogenic alpha-amylase / neopullulanase
VEASWVRHAIWWRLYPLGFTGAYPESAGSADDHTEHRLLRIVPWLDHVVELGCSGIALGPIFASSTHGYDTTDHFRIDPRLGTDGDFATLVGEAHDRGLRVQLDGVFNHVGREHPLAAAALRDGPDSPAARWLLTTGEPGDRRFVPFEGHDLMLTLDHEDDEVRRLVVDVMCHWLDRGADAWRLDAAYAVPTELWAAVLPEVRRAHPEVWFEAEVIHGDYAGFVAASTADTLTQYELWKAIWSSINDRNLHELAWTLTRHNELLEGFAPATFIGNHDVTRISSRITDSRHLDHAVVLLALLGGTPTIYAGDELGLRGVKEDRVGGDDAVRPLFPATPEQVEHPDLRLLELHRRLLGLRRRNPWLHRARSDPVGLDNEHATFALAAAGERLVLTLNLSDRPISGDPTGLLDSDPETRTHPETVAPHGWAIFRG